MGDRPKVTVRMAWMYAHPKRMWQMRFWKRVGQQVKAKGVPHRNMAAIRQIIKEIENDY